MTEAAEKKSYKETLNLPQTAFAMKANLVQREPEFQRRWERLRLYERLRELGSEGKPKFVLHDGPPYANGALHLGHLLNKVMKDLVVRSRTMLGYDAPFTPGWDCHGLPIEHKVMQERVQGSGFRVQGADPQPPALPGDDRIAIRRACRKYAEKYHKLQTLQMQRLGTMADYDHPYRTMDPVFEAATLEVFARLVSRGLVYRDLKPVHWSIENRTALAEAELEYEDRTDPSIYTIFEIDNPQVLPAGLMARPGTPVSLMVWTTTPWTLPANLAVAVGQRVEYGLYRWEHAGQSGLSILATSMAAKVFEKVGATHTRLGVCSGAELAAAGVRYRHPFLDQEGSVLTAGYVSTEDGTGLVHTAPGHGAEDYQTGIEHGLKVYCPVRDDGTLDDTVPDWLRGKSVWEANPLIVARLRESGRLFLEQPITHSYPHDWRSKTPVIFRATQQWFISVNQPVGTTGVSLRESALRAVEKKVRFIPAWGRNRMRGMLEARPDWCISRQRAWGLPIPAFFGPENGQVLLTAASVRAVAKVVAEHGSDVWFKAEPSYLLAQYDPTTDPEAPDWFKSKIQNPNSKIRKSSDIFDVWFESGSTWNEVLRGRGLEIPADLYLEGTDQHRGWFQSSLLLSLGATDEPAFREVLTHGFIVDKFGRKMSKSEGNTLDVEELLKSHGADVCRWWVASLNTDNDVKADVEFFRLAGEEYRTVRNTIRFLLSNLGGFDPARDRRELTDDDAYGLDAWARGELEQLVTDVRSDYERSAFRRVHDRLFEFCNQTLSAVYLAAVKDRLYCDAAGSDRRRRTQTVLYDTADALIRLVAPILPHTADEAWLALRGGGVEDDDCVHLHAFPEPSGGHAIASDAWGDLLALRARVMKQLEDARSQRGIKNPLDAGIEVALTPEAFAKLSRFDACDLADLHGVSRFALEEDGTETVVIQDLREEPRCERSWKRDGTVRERSDGGMLSDRDAKALGLS